MAADEDAGVWMVADEDADVQVTVDDVVEAVDSSLITSNK